MFPSSCPAVLRVSKTDLAQVEDPHSPALQFANREATASAALLFTRSVSLDQLVRSTLYSLEAVSII